MGKVLAVLGGIAAILIGIVLFTIPGWLGSFLVMLKGCIPPFLILGGLIAFIAGASEIKDYFKEKKEEKKKGEEKEEEKKE